MPINRFYFPQPFVQDTLITLDGSEHHHLSHVMKCLTGEKVELVNGQGVLGFGKIVAIEKKKTLIQIECIENQARQSSFFILAIPMMRPSKLEWVIEKGTELGADLFLIYRAHHSEKGIISEHALERMFHIAVASMKQSGRLYLPGFEVIEHLPAVFQHEALFLFGDIRNGNHNEFKHHPRICFISGPERGFSAEEEIFLQKNGIGVRLSPNILRAETAPIAAMSIMNYTMYNK